MIQEALQNLIDNAVKHAGADNKEISVRVTTRDRSGLIFGSDKGAGLSAGDSELAFSRFAQMEPGDGSGLGLAIVKEIADLHTGSARIEPSEIGAKIALSIPLAVRSPAE